jgi:tetratricopeptide (TPR) repeat protein
MSRRKIDANFVCVWLDKKTSRSEDYINVQDQLRNVINFFRTFNKANQCVDFTINANNAKIVLITSDEFAEIIIPVIHSFEQIFSIYIFTSNKSTNDKWTKDYEKVKGFFNELNFLCHQIKQDIIESRNDSIAISFISSVDVTSNDVNRQDPSFMYSQLLKEIILNDQKEEKEEETRRDMLIYCRKVYANSQNTLIILDEFEENYIPELSIYWYTRECFLYQILNKALWTPEPDVLYKLRYFLRHLHQQILSQAALQRKNLSPVIVYRGQNMSLDQIEKLKHNVGGFLSFNNFLSTSLKEVVALNFLWGSDSAGVLFEMKVDPSIEKFPFANIEHLSYQQGKDSEEEFLFSMGTVFRILRIDKQKDFYRVQLTLSVDIDEQLAEYTKHTRGDTRSPHSFLSLVKLMQVLAQYKSVDQFAEMLREDRSLSTNTIVLGSIHHAFGTIYNDRGQSKQALDHFCKSLSHYMNVMSADHPKLSPTYNNIGSAHAALSDYETALTFHQLALDCQTNSDNPDISSIVTYTNNIAAIYFQQEKFTEALEYHKRALQLQKQYLGENDASLTSTYNRISVIYYKLHDYAQAS